MPGSSAGEDSSIASVSGPKFGDAMPIWARIAAEVYPSFHPARRDRVKRPVSVHALPPGHVATPPAAPPAASPWRACARRISDQLRAGAAAGSAACGRPPTSTTGYRRSS